ncbi:carboxypeptidase-like regulatory domain-containing protein [Granulicella sp. dw_53]|uniref:carboxypeptidase-like regulatory domain-containing protein n=1 Tax=Granulicella sp. dw_53 TaxID=2719792 RepID=UPI001BD559B1|nr:carboxypeptidase-like regulatory domain-containing protein [Granulicella sp. dw_53]
MPVANRITSLFTFILAGLVATSFLAETPPTQPSPYSITGTVVSTLTGLPVPRCHLVPSKIDRGSANLRRTVSQQNGVDTDEHGHFTMPLSSVGRWSLGASAKGYRPQLYDQHGDLSSTIVLTEETPRFDLLFRLVPDSVITGIILDEGNEPVRQAQISVYAVPRSGVEGQQASTRRTFAITDDRGRYEVAALAPGDYRVSVSARAWYAQSLQVGRPRSSTSQIDPSLDVVYPVTWFPGVSSVDAAEVLTLHDGETRQADMQLQPIPAIHLRIPLPAADLSVPAANRRMPRAPQVTSVSPNGAMPLSMSINQGELDVAGLAPGLYRIQAPDENGQLSHSTIVNITASSAHNLDLGAATTTASVSLILDGVPGTESLPITFVDAGNDHEVFRSMPTSHQFQNGQRSLRSLPESQASSSDRPARILDLPPGRYLVYQNGSMDFFLTGLTQGTKEIPGRMVTVPSGESSLTIHIATGRAKVSGVVSLDKKPLAGALVLLVPISLDEAGSIAETRRDQTNTDGSYDLNSVIPGQYILVAIEHGWNVNWNDPSTLARYLTHGIPLDLRSSANVTPEVVAQLP